jgi:hypothetical protein
MNRHGKVRCVLYTCTSERDNPYDQLTQPREHAAWHDAYWAVWQESNSQGKDPSGTAALKEECALEQRQFALVWRPFRHPFRLRVNDVVRIDGRLCRVIRVTECAAVLLMNPPLREFTTRFDRHVRFQPRPVTFRISANSPMEILNRKVRRPKKSKPRKTSMA